MTVTLIPCCTWCSRLTVDGEPVGEPVDTSDGPYTYGLCTACAPAVWAQLQSLISSPGGQR